MRSVTDNKLYQSTYDVGRDRKELFKPIKNQAAHEMLDRLEKESIPPPAGASCKSCIHREVHSTNFHRCTRKNNKQVKLYNICNFWSSGESKTPVQKGVDT